MKWGWLKTLGTAILPQVIKALPLPPGVDQLVDAGMDRILERQEELHPAPGTGPVKATGAMEDVAANLLPLLESLTGKNLNDPAVTALFAALRDTTVKAKNLYTAAMEAQQEVAQVRAALLGAISAIKQPADHQ